MNDLNNPILLLFRHLVITRKTQPSPENIGSNVDSRAFYIGICAASAISFYRDKRIRPVYRLHMHGLPSTLSTHHVRTNRFALLFMPTSQLFY